MFTTSGTYPWSLVTHIFRNGQPSHIYNDNPDLQNKNVSVTVVSNNCLVRIKVYAYQYDNYSIVMGLHRMMLFEKILFSI